MATLLVIYGKDQGKRHTLERGIARVGRDTTNAIRLHDTEISRQHAEFRRRDDNFIVADLDSSNGTYVNGRRVREAVLQSGDRIQIGQTVLLFNTGTTATRDELAGKISMIAREKEERASSIIKSLPQSAGSQFIVEPEVVEGQWLRGALSNLAVLYQASQLVSKINDIDELLNRILELCFQSLPADRGCVLLKMEGSSEYEPRALHWREGVSREEKVVISRTIVDYVLQHGEGVRTSDAASDERFNPGQSIMKLGIREAICVPMEGRHGMIGVLYMDNRVSMVEDSPGTTPPRKFNDEHLKLLIAIGRQAALAVEDTRFYQAVVQSERLAAIGQTIATLSHHIKNILQGVKGGSHLIEMGLNSKEQDLVRRGWNIVDKNQNKIYNLVMDMLTYSKEREPAYELSDLNEVVRDVVELMAPHAAELGVDLQFRADPNLSPMSIDPEGIHRAVLNIVTNALDATEGKEKAQVHVRTRIDTPAGLARILVRDNGTGIPAEDVPHIFQLFSSTKGARGTGIGLPVSEKIVREHGGRIVVRSQSGEGTEFIIELPLRTETGDCSVRGAPIAPAG